MIIEDNVPTSGAIQVPQCVLKIFCNLLDHYGVSSSKPIGKDDSTSVVSFINSIVQSNTINPIQAETLFKHSQLCIGIEIAFQSLILQISGDLDDYEDGAYISNWSFVQDYIQKTFKNDL